MKKILMIIMSIIMTISMAKASDLGIEDRCQSYLIGHYETGEILEQYNIDKPVSIASVSKLMTYLVVKDNIKAGKIKMDDRVTITKEVEAVGGSNFGLVDGEVLTVKQLLDGLMVVSGNDAAYALAVKTAGTEKDFVVLMNQKAQELKLENAKFFNSSGLQEGSNQNTLTTKDIFILAKNIIDNYPEVLEYSQIQVLNMPERNFYGNSTIPLAGEMPGVDGLKTGFTEEAGYCLVSTMDARKTPQAQDYRLITVVMGTSSIGERRDLTKFLLEYGLDNYSIRNLIEDTVPFTQIEIKSAEKKEVQVYPSESYKMLVKKGNKYALKSDLDELIKAPLEAGTKVGKLSLTSDNKEIKTVDLIIKNPVEQANLVTRFLRGIENIFNKLITLIKG